MAKFEDVTEDVKKLMNDIIKSDFPTLANAKIKMLFLMNKKTSGGNMILGSMNKATPRENYLTSNDGEDGVNYIMILDGNIFHSLDQEAKKRIIRHELNHAHIDLDAKDPYKIVGHEIEDFFKEVEYNKDEPRWKDRVFAIAEQIYEDMEEQKKNKGK